MILIPSIELRRGAVVSSRHPASPEVEPEILCDDPLVVARALEEVGALFFHVVDADAVAEEGDQMEVIQGLVERGIACEVIGGITDPEQAERIAAAGVDRLVVAPALFDDREAGAALVERLGHRLAVGLEVEGDQVRAVGRRADRLLPLQEVVATLHEAGVGRVVHRVCGASSPDLESIQKLLECTEMEVFASAPISGKQDLEDLGGLAEQGLTGVIIEDAARRVLSQTP